jgi:hypothetical protein
LGIGGVIETGSWTLPTPTPTPVASGCTYSPGYWRNHPEGWPVSDLGLGTELYTVDELLALLLTPTRSDASLLLAQQLIAAKLNVANQADDSAVAGAIDEADAWLGSYSGRLPYDVPASSRAGQAAIVLATLLGAYNNGQIGPGLCKDAAHGPVLRPEAALAKWRGVSF